MKRTSHHNGFGVDITGPGKYVDDAVAALNSFQPLLDAAVAATNRCSCDKLQVQAGHVHGCFAPELEAAIRLAKVTSRTPARRGGGA